MYGVKALKNHLILKIIDFFGKQLTKFTFMYVKYFVTNVNLILLFLGNAFKF